MQLLKSYQANYMLGLRLMFGLVVLSFMPCCVARYRLMMNTSRLYSVKLNVSVISSLESSCLLFCYLNNSFISISNNSVLELE